MVLVVPAKARSGTQQSASEIITPLFAVCLDTLGAGCLGGLTMRCILMAPQVVSVFAAARAKCDGINLGRARWITSVQLCNDC